MASVLTLLGAACPAPVAPRAGPYGAGFRLRAVYFDLDGTLLDKNHQVRSKSVEAIGRLRACGTAIGIASGRTMEQVVGVLGVVKPTLPLVLFNGGVTLSADGRVPLHAARLNNDVVHGVVRMAAGIAGVGGVVAHFERETWTDRRSSALDHHLTTAGTSVQRTCAFETCLPSAPDAQPVKMLLWVSPQEAESVTSTLRAKLEGLARVLVTNPREATIEVIPPQVSKAAAIRAVLASQGLGMDELAVFGDSENDVEMVREARIGVAMGNCHPQTCAAGWLTTRGNDTDAISEVIQRVLLPMACRAR